MSPTSGTPRRRIAEQPGLRNARAADLGEVVAGYRTRPLPSPVEPCWYAVRKGRTDHWQGDRKQSTLWQIPNVHRTQGDVDDKHTNHSTQKPVEAMRPPLLNNSRAGASVYEPFMGLGTTLITAEQSGRRCFSLELNPAYVDVAVER